MVGNVQKKLTIDRNVLNDWKWLKSVAIAGNGWKLLEIAKKCLEWLELAENG